MAMAEGRRTLDDGSGTLTLARRLVGALVLAIAALMAIRAGYYCWTALTILRWPFEIHGGESTMLHESQLMDANFVASLREIYGPERADRFTAGNYPPLYLILWALDPGGSSYITGRALALVGGIIAALAGGVAVAFTVEGGRLWRAAIGLLGGAIFLCTVPVFQQITIAKPDMIALAFAACGLAAYAIFPNTRGALLAGFLCALAGLTKQSVGFGTLAILIAATRQHWRIGLAFLASCGATVLVALGTLGAIVGPTLYDHLITYNQRYWRQDRFNTLNGKFIEQHWPVLLAALLYTVWAVWRRPRSPLSYFPLTAATVMIMVGSDGAARNYYVELCLALGLAAALGVGTFLRAARPVAATLGAAATLLVAIHLFRAYTLFIVGLYVPTLPLNERDPNPTLAVVDAAADPVLVLADDPGYLVMRERPVAIDDPFLASLMIREGHWDPTAIIDNLNARRYTIVLAVEVTDDELRKAWGDEMIDALLANYESQGDWFVPKR
jgi:4-amino-4-deoxy-L-arabinose transferase-like glycosyltransferase